MSTTHTLEVDGRRVRVKLLVVIPIHRLMTFEKSTLQSMIIDHVWGYARDNVCSEHELESVTDMEMLSLATVSDDYRFQISFSFTRKIKPRHNAQWNF